MTSTRFRNARIAACATAIGASLLVAGSASAQSTQTIDFSTYPLGTPVTTVGDATFTLQGGPGTGIPVTGSFGTASLGNSPTGDYPTAQVLDVAFAAPVSNISFTFDNFGDNSAFGPSTATAYNALGAVVGMLNISTGAYANSFAPGSIAGSGITDLKFDNGSGGTYSWEFGVQTLSFDAAVPEPATWAMMLVGFGMLGAGLRYGRKTTTAKVSIA